jgi:hypothetical protein
LHINIDLQFLVVLSICLIVIMRRYFEAAIPTLMLFPKGTGMHVKTNGLEVSLG